MKRKYLLSEGCVYMGETAANGQTFWQKIGAALTDPDKAFSLPVVYPVELNKPTRNAIMITAGILGVSLITAAAIQANKNGRK